MVRAWILKKEEEEEEEEEITSLVEKKTKTSKGNSKNKRPHERPVIRASTCFTWAN